MRFQTRRRALSSAAFAHAATHATQVEARELARRLLQGDESAVLEEKHREAQRLLELLENSRAAFRVTKDLTVNPRPRLLSPVLSSTCAVQRAS